MTQEQINELRKLAEAATPGPWNTSPGGCGIIGPDKQWLGGMNDWVCEYSEEMTQSENNAAFIAAANPAAILDMIAEVESLRDQVNGLTGSLERAEKALKEAQEQQPVLCHAAFSNGDGTYSYDYVKWPLRTYEKPVHPVEQFFYARPVPAAVAAPAVPKEWREVMTELADDLSIELDMRYQSRSHYPSELRKYENEMQPVYRARALLQSAEVAK